MAISGIFTLAVIFVVLDVALKGAKFLLRLVVGVVSIAVWIALISAVLTAAL